MRSIRTLTVALSIVFAIPTASGQGKTTKSGIPPGRKLSTQKTGVGAVVGRVFAITKGGDLKPARLAMVYLFFNRGPGVSEIVASAGTTPGLIFLQKDLDGLKEGDPALCMRDLVAADKAILATLDWSKTKHLTDLVRFTDADEDGYFQIENARPGTYDLVARGQAGSNNAYWEEDVEVKPNQKTEVKMASVQAACSNLD